MTLDYAQQSFRERPCNGSAGNYLKTVVEYFLAEMIGAKTLSEATNEIAHWLKTDKLTVKA